MSEDMKDSAEESETQKTEVKLSELSADNITDEFVDEVSETLLEGEENIAGDVELTEDEEKIEDEEAELELEEEKIKDEIDIQIDLLSDTDWVVRREAVITLGEMADERCVEPLVRTLRDGDWQVREASVEAIAEVGPPAVDMLLRYVRDWDTRKYAIRAMGKINDERVLEPLVSMLKNDEFKDDATRALIELGKPAVPRLIEALTDKEEFVRKQAIEALGEIKDPQAVDPLVALLQDQDWYTRLTAAASLEKIGDLRGRDAIKPLMKDPDLIVRMRVERILAAWKKQPANA